MLAASLTTKDRFLFDQFGKWALSFILFTLSPLPQTFLTNVNLFTLLYVAHLDAPFYVKRNQTKGKTIWPTTNKPQEFEFLQEMSIAVSCTQHHLNKNKNSGHKMKVANTFREIGLQSAILQPEYVSRLNESVGHFGFRRHDLISQLERRLINTTGLGEFSAKREMDQ